MIKQGEGKIMYEKLEAIEQEIGKVIKGKKDVIRKVLMAICASGHVLWRIIRVLERLLWQKRLQSHGTGL